MAKYRQIHVSYWQDSFILDLPTEEKFFYIYLMTNSKTTQCGIYELPLKVVEMETGLSSDRIFELLHKFVNYRRIWFHEETREVMLLNWLKHNNLKSIKVLTCAVKEIESIKHIPYVDEFYRQCNLYEYPIDTLPIPYPKGYKPSWHVYGEEEEREREEEKEEKEKEKEKQNISPSDLLNNQHEKHITALLKKYIIEMDKPFQTERFFSYIGATDIEVIEAAIKKSTGKGIAYCLAVLEGMISDGVTKESLKPKVGDKNAESIVQHGRASSESGADEKPSGWLPSKWNRPTDSNVVQLPNVSG